MQTFLEQATSLAVVQELEQSAIASGKSMLVYSPRPASEFAEPSAKRKQETKPKCTKGTACGYSCINGKYTCSDKILKRDADALLAAATKKPDQPASSHKIFTDEAARKIVQQITNTWIEGARAKSYEKLDSIAEDPEDPRSSQARSYRDIIDELSNNSDSYGEFIAAKTAGNRFAAAAEINRNKDGVELVNLLGSPLAILGTTEEQADVKGGGTSVLQSIARIALEHTESTGKPAKISLNAVGSAMGFYRKLGAKPLKERSTASANYEFDEAAIRKLAGLS